MKVIKSAYQQPMEPWPTLKQFAKTTHIEETDIDLFYYETNHEKKPALLMIHGLGDEADTWRYVFDALARDYHLIAPDLPGFGRSDKPDVDYTPDFMISTLIGLLDKIGVDQTILIGSSLGAMLSHAIALEHPGRVQGVVLIGGALLQTNKMADRGLRLMQIPFLGEWLYTRLRKNPDAAFDSMRNVYHDLDKMPNPDREFLYHRVNQRVWSDGQRRAYFSTLRSLIPWLKTQQSTILEQFSEMSTPCLIIRGEFDPLFSQENGKALAEIQKNTSMTTIDNAGHLPHQENPQAVMKIIQTWLSKYFQLA